MSCFDFLKGIVKGFYVDNGGLERVFISLRSLHNRVGVYNLYYSKFIRCSVNLNMKCLDVPDFM